MTDATRTLIEAAKRDAPRRELEGAVLGTLGLSTVAVTTTPSFAAKLWSALVRAAASKVSVGVLAVAAASGTYEAVRFHENAPSKRLEHPAVAMHAAADAPTSKRIESLASAAPEKKIAPPPKRAALPSATALAPTDAIASPPRAARATAATPTGTSTASTSTASTSTATFAAAAAPSTSASDTTPSASSLGLEIASIRRARASVLSGDGKAALAELDSYDALHPRGELREEALALRVRAARAVGDEEAASRALERLATQFPGSVQLRALEKKGAAPDQSAP